jgi:hypothetical protein
MWDFRQKTRQQSGLVNGIAAFMAAGTSSRHPVFVL